jgi:purine-nucleoside phosphorylase
VSHHHHSKESKHAPKLVRHLDESAAVIKERLGKRPLPETLVVLGSGFKSVTAHVKNGVTIPMSEIPHFPVPRVEGHGADILIGEVGGREVCFFTGRCHLYEGHSAADSVYPLRAMARAGIKNVLLTNAAGSVDLNYHPGDVVVISDHINFQGRNCLVDSGLDLGPVFIDMGSCYDAEWRKRLLSMDGLKEGVYCSVMGPSFETGAEVRMIKSWGANVVGMSTVQEAIAARQLGVKVAGLSFVTNWAGNLGGHIDHKDVLEIGRKNAERLANILVNGLGA